MPKPQHVHELYIRTTPERLWDALTTPELVSAYFPTGAPVIGEVLEAEPPWRLVTAFSLADDPEAAAEVPSRVTWEIYAAGELCRLRLTHSDFGGLSRTWAATAGFWPPVISGLKTLLETGEPLGPVVLPPLEGDAVDVDAEWHRDLGIDTNQEVWGSAGPAGPHPGRRRGDGPRRLRLRLSLVPCGAPHRGQRGPRRVDAEPRPRRARAGGHGPAPRAAVPGRRRGGWAG